MKTLRQVLAYVTLAAGCPLFAQVGINTTSPGAQLDIRSANQAAPSNTDGLLIPKVDVFPASNPGAAQDGMMVYLTTASGTNAPGFYYWNNASASWIAVGAKSGWALGGNSGTSPATQFVGTTDTQALAIRTDNTERLRVSAAGNIGVNTAAPQSKLHVFGGSSGMTPNPFSVATFETPTDGYVSLLTGGETGLIFGSGGVSTNGAIIYNPPGLPNSMLLRTNGNVNRLVIGPTGNVALGNFIPSFALQFPDVLGDKIGIWGSGANHYGIGLQSNVMQIHSDFNFSDIAFGYGSSGTFGETVRFKGNGNVGFGVSNPLFPLQFPAILGDKIVLYNSGPTQYGFGVQNSLLQIHSSYSGSDIAFGWGTSAALNENMRIKGNGNVGIGTSAPTAKLHVVGLASGLTPNANASVIVDATNYSFINLLSTAESGIVFGSNGSGTNGGLIFNSGSNTDGIGFRAGGNVNRMLLSSAGSLSIGSTMPAARLDINASNTATPANTDGILVPRVAAFPITNPTASQNGMMIFLTNGVGQYPAGFYYWDDAAASWYGVGTKNNWSTTGNSGTNPVSYFVGTSDNNDLSMRANNTEVMRLTTGNIAQVNGYTKLGSAAPAVKMVKLTGTTASSQGTSILIAHGVSSSKILDVSALVEYTPGSFVPPCYTVNAGYEFQCYVNGAQIVIINKTGNSGSILGKPVRVLVTYEQ